MRSGSMRFFLALCTLLAVVLRAGTAFAQPAPPVIPAPPQLAAKAWILVDADSGKVIVEHNSEERLPPASLTKMMTSYIVSKEVTAGRIKEEEMARVSENAWRTGGWASGSSVMSLMPNSEARIIDLLRGVIIQSGNDASIVLAEHLAGSEEAFADIMNQQAEILGMKDSHFMNATGLPAENHYTTAHDLTILGRALVRDYPEHYKIYAEKYFEYDNHRQANRNGLLWKDDSVDGIKTGHTEEAGYCLVASAKRDGMRLVSVVLGADSVSARETQTQQLLTYGFRFYETHKQFEPGQQVAEARVWGGARDAVPLVVKDGVYLTLPRGRGDQLQTEVVVDEVVKAPVVAGARYGDVVVKADGEEVLRQPLVAAEAVEQGGFFKRVWHAIVLFFKGLFGY